MTLSGFSVEELRQFISFLVKQNVSYLHICEGAPDLEKKKIPI
jgi:formiminoglutamase